MEFDKNCIDQLEEVFNQFIIETASFMNEWISPFVVVGILVVVTAVAILLVQKKITTKK